MTHRYLCTVSYDGSNYSGFQRQLNSSSIQTEIEKAIKNMTTIETTIHSAGRTDKGVHALAQTFHFDLLVELDCNVLVNGLNKRLNDDIIIKDVKKVSDSFHARHHAKERIYEYKIAKKQSNIFSQRYEVYIENFDIDIAKECTKLFLGTKDFTGFAKMSKEKDPIRTIKSIEIKETSSHYTFTFIGVSFLRYMVRSIMGTIIEVSTNKKDITVIEEIFNTNNRKLAGKTAEAKGLFLKKVIY